MIANPITDYAVTAAGLLLAVLAQLPDTNGIPTVVSMGSVVAILLWMTHQRDQRQSEERKAEREVAEAREVRQQKRIESLEEQHADQFASLAAKQNECAIRQLEATVRNEQMMSKVEATLGEFNSALQVFVAGRPCLLERMNEGKGNVERTETVTIRGSGEPADAEH